MNHGSLLEVKLFGHCVRSRGWCYNSRPCWLWSCLWPLFTPFLFKDSQALQNVFNGILVANLDFEQIHEVHWMTRVQRVNGLSEPNDGNLSPVAFMKPPHPLRDRVLKFSLAVTSRFSAVSFTPSNRFIPFGITPKIPSSHTEFRIYKERHSCVVVAALVA